MTSAEVRSRFLSFFEQRGHRVLPSSSLVPADDPTLLFTNAGMVQFKKVFLGGEEPVAERRAATSQKCVRAGGKHNDLEQVGHTARHNTFFEMLGNFSFGDYFKRDAIAFAWEFVTAELKLDPNHLRVSVHHGDDDARKLWREIAGLPDSRIYGLGDKDNFWQMADTGPCGPCSEIFVDMAHVARDWRFPQGARGEWTELNRDDFSLDGFIAGTEGDRFLEFWNLVFMQYDRQPDGTLVPLPKPSVDTGAGLERMSAITQGVTSIFHTDVFAPLIEAVTAATRHAYDPSDGAAHRVMADHARAVAFLLADGVFPSNEGRGYVLRRILRRAVRHAWLLGRREPTLVLVVAAVIEQLGGAYPELRQREKHITDTTRREEESFLATIEAGLSRFEQIAPPRTADGGADIRGTISGEDAFRLYDTFGFPIDLTELMARERGYTVDIAGFENALEVQRRRSQEERRSRGVGVAVGATLDEWEVPAEVRTTAARTAEYSTAPAEGTMTASLAEVGDVRFVGYDAVEVDTEAVAVRRGLPEDRVAVIVRDTPFYAESGGQISDVGELDGEGWRLDVDEVRRVDGKIVLAGRLEGEFRFGRVTARVPRARRLDTERNHTATHLLHAALRSVLGEHVHQAGSLVAPDRLRFDFTHHGPLSPEQIAEVEEHVNDGIFAAEPVRTEQRSYQEAVSQGAMALFGEKYGDVVRVVSIPGRSMELCGGTHVRNTAEIGLFRITRESGIASGIRRIEAVTGKRAFELMRDRERELARIKRIINVKDARVAEAVEALVAEKKAKRDAAPDTSAALVDSLLARSASLDGVKLVAAPVELPDIEALRTVGDSLRAALQSGVGVLAARLGEDKHTVLVVVTDDLRDRGLRADVLVREVAAVLGGRGGGKPHMAQAGVPDPARISDVLARVPDIVTRHLRDAR